MKCDICQEKVATRERIVEDGLGNLIIMSFCSDVCQEKSPFSPVSNEFYLDKSQDDEVE